ncbi:MAG: TrmH family RNA methyltransferase [Spirochaetaceae bacterium]|nr:TrmH family RNA methyltransferase [Spirochaetaceae bacterium]RKX76864.1 MAG: TrmH family RNA methyltransferase [Spirochaetota bacterium]RKX88992.1 MAG: TrmH family RNA methyltransferase [Spirochaetota bacterium]RKX96495.1 MAG: TrmH family RNA methyltransferase [Spirochaetota bacterium]
MSELISQDDFWGESIRKRAVQFSFDDGELLWNLNSLRHSMLLKLGRDWADWDIEAAVDNHPADTADGRTHKTFPVRVYLDGLRSPFNAGSVMRTALAFGVEQCWFSPEGCSPDHRRARRSSMGAVDRIKWDVKTLKELSDTLTGTLFALELGGADISDFEFPRSGTVIIGSEELGVSPPALRRAENDGGIVSIHLPGPKASLNAGVAFGILLRQWIQSINQR